MPRIRTIKPEFWSDEKLSPLDPMTRLVFLGLISMADDAGRLIDNVKSLDGQLFPNTEDSARESLDTLAILNRISRYRVGSGQNIIQIVKWEDHQKVDNPSKYVLPAPSEAIPAEVGIHQPLTPAARHHSENRSKVSRESRVTTLDLGPRTKDLSLAPKQLGARVSKKVGGYSLVFEEAWKVYPPCPRKTKAAAWLQWRARLRQGESEEAMLAGTRAFALSRGGEDPQYTMSPARFYGRERHYETDYSPVAHEPNDEDALEEALRRATPAMRARLASAEAAYAESVAIDAEEARAAR